MAFAPTSPVTGATVTGVTSPTFTLTADGQTGRVKGYYVSTLGGTQTGVNTHSVSDPYQATMYAPASIPTQGIVDPLTGILRNNPWVTWNLSMRKGLLPLAGQARQNASIQIISRIPVGAEAADAVALASFYSFAGGLFMQVAGGYRDSVLTGTT